MSKMLSGSAIISYGPTLPPAASTPAGALFYKTDSTGGSPQGLYMYGFVRDINPSVLGSQVAQSWVQVVSPDLFVLKGGDTMTGPLTVPAVLRVTSTSASQRVLIGTSSSNPLVIDATSGSLSIGAGTNWGTGGTVANSLVLTPASGATGITWIGNQVWHAGKMGATSGLDADLLDGQHGSYYLNAGNMSSGTLPITRGGTGQTSTVVGGVVYGSSLTAYSTTTAGTIGQVLTSNGPGAPKWTNQSDLSVGSATNADYANSANSATIAASAITADSVKWTGLSGLFPEVPQAISSRQTLTNYPFSGINAIARPSYFFNMGGGGGQSLPPGMFPRASLSGFDGYFTSDIGQYQVGITVIGDADYGAHSFQFAAGWNFAETTPSGALKYRVNDYAGDVSAWGPWRVVWDQGNLTSLSQLTNDAYFAVTKFAPTPGGVSQFTNDAGYLTQAGASGGGTDKVFWENDTVVSTNYTITSGKNAMTAGPITINSGVTVTVPSGSVWTIV